MALEHFVCMQVQLLFDERWMTLAERPAAKGLLIDILLWCSANPQTKGVIRRTVVAAIAGTSYPADQLRSDSDLLCKVGFLSNRCDEELLCVGDLSLWRQRDATGPGHFDRPNSEVFHDGRRKPDGGFGRTYSQSPAAIKKRRERAKRKQAGA
jgi:hypothetical protein